jgi:DNA mismatch endonuclease (patch repair protein)
MTSIATARLKQLRGIVGKPPAPSSDAVRRTMRGNRRRDSTPETRLRSVLHSFGLRYRVDLPIRVPNRRPIRPDIVFTRARLVIFVDGCFWHGCPNHGRPPRTNSTYWAAKIELNRERDGQQTIALEEAGWTVVRIWEHEPVEIAAAAVLALLRG